MNAAALMVLVTLVALVVVLALVPLGATTPGRGHERRKEACDEDLS